MSVGARKVESGCRIQGPSPICAISIGLDGNGSVVVYLGI